MKNRLATFGLLATVVLAGCNIGEAPSGSPEAVKDQFNAMKPEEQIKFIESSPMPPAEKQQRIAEIKQKAGITGETTPAQGSRPGG